jgi:nucleoid DNA-binding protein
MSSSPEKSPRQELISYIANATEMTKEQSSKALLAVLDGITNLLKEGKKIPLIGLVHLLFKSEKLRKCVILKQVK